MSCLDGKDGRVIPYETILAWWSESLSACLVRRGPSRHGGEAVQKGTFEHSLASSRTRTTPNLLLLCTYNWYYLIYTASPHAPTKLHNLRAQRAQAAPPFVRFDSRTLLLVWMIVSLAPSQRFLLPSKTRWMCGLQMPPVKRLLYFGSLSRNPQPLGP